MIRRVALALLLVAAAFGLLVLRPLEMRSRALDADLARAAAPGADAGPGESLARFYRFLDDGRDATDWLAKLYAIGLGTGVELKAAEYRTPRSTGRIERLEIVLPVSGSYAHLRAFVGRALAEIPSLALDQLTLRRSSPGETVVQGEAHFTLYRLKTSGGKDLS